MVTVLIQAGSGGKIKRTASMGTREMAQGSQVCTALAEGPHLLSSTHVYTHTHTHVCKIYVLKTKTVCQFVSLQLV